MAARSDAPNVAVDVVGAASRRREVMKRNGTTVKARAAAVAMAATLTGGAALATAGTAASQGPTPAQLTQVGWTCIQPRLFPTQLLCFPPGVGLPPLPGTA